MFFFSKGRIIGLCCTVATLIGAIVILLKIAADGDLSKLKSLLKINTLLSLFFLYSCHFLAEPMRWLTYSVNPLTGVPQNGRNFIKIFACFNITALLSYSLPFKLGLPLRVFLLGHFLQIENAKLIKLMVMDSMFSLLCWILASLFLYFLISEIVNWSLAHLNFLLVSALIAVASIAGYWLIKTKGEQLLVILRTETASTKTLIMFTLIIDILLYGVRHLVLANMLGLNVPEDDVFAIGILATFVGIISALPMGLGAYDVTLVALLGSYGVDVEIGLLLAFSNRLGMIVTSIVLGIPSAVALLHSKVMQVES